MIAERPHLCHSCTHSVHIEGEGKSFRGCSYLAGPGGVGFCRITRKVQKCTNYHQRNTLSMYQMERLAFMPDDNGVWKKPDRKAGFSMEPEY